MRAETRIRMLLVCLTAAFFGVFVLAVVSAQAEAGCTRDINLIYGTADGERIVGTACADRIEARGGADDIDPRAGNDTVYAGRGGDFIDALDGYPDVLRCGDGQDTVQIDPGLDDVADNCEFRVEAS